MSTEGPRHAVITADDQGALLQIAAWFLMVVMILATSSRVMVRLNTSQVPGIDDIVTVGAMVAILSHSPFPSARRHPLNHLLTSPLLAAVRHR